MSSGRVRTWTGCGNLKFGSLIIGGLGLNWQPRIDRQAVNELISGDLVGLEWWVTGEMEKWVAGVYGVVGGLWI